MTFSTSKRETSPPPKFNPCKELNISYAHYWGMTEKYSKVVVQDLSSEFCNSSAGQSISSLLRKPKDKDGFHENPTL
jgi:hypothetical protein